MFRAAHRSSSGAPQTVFAASGLHTHVVTGRCQGWVGNWSGILTVIIDQVLVQYLIHFPLSLDNGLSPHVYVNRCKYSLDLLMMSGVPLETCW